MTQRPLGPPEAHNSGGLSPEYFPTGGWYLYRPPVFCLSPYYLVRTGEIGQKVLKLYGFPSDETEDGLNGVVQHLSLNEIQS